MEIYESDGKSLQPTYYNIIQLHSNLPPKSLQCVGCLMVARGDGRATWVFSMALTDRKLFSFTEMEDYLKQVAQNHSDFVKVTVEGRTEERRPIYLLKIGGGGEDDPLTSTSTMATIFIDAGKRLQLLLHPNHFIVYGVIHNWHPISWPIFFDLTI